MSTTSFQPGETLEALRIVTDRLADNRLQLAELDAVAHRQRLESWFGHDSKYISERDRVAEFNTLDLSEDMIRLKGEIAADEDRRLFLCEVLKWCD